MVAVRSRADRSRRPPQPRAPSPLDRRYLLLISAVAAFGGFLLGYEISVLTGALGYVKTRFGLDADPSGWAGSSLSLGCLYGAILGGIVSDRLGRRTGLILGAAWFFAASVATAMPQSLPQFAWARFLGGLAIGTTSVVAPVYIGEVAPPAARGRLIALFPLAIILGLITAYVTNLQIERLGDAAWNTETGWRWMFGALALPSVIGVAFLAVIPESYRWLIRIAKPVRARAILERMSSPATAARQMEEVALAQRGDDARWSQFVRGAYRRPLVLILLLAALSQCSGIHALREYGAVLFRATGLPQDAALRESLVAGGVGLVFLIIAIGFVDRAGRRPLLLVGLVLQTLAHGLIGWQLYRGHDPELLFAGTLVFIAAYALSLGPLFWVLATEFFPTRRRGRAVAMAVLVFWQTSHWTSEALPFLRSRFGPAPTFWGYAAGSLIAFLLVLAMVPETKGRTLEEIQAAWRLRR